VAAFSVYEGSEPDKSTLCCQERNIIMQNMQLVRKRRERARYKASPRHESNKDTYHGEYSTIAAGRGVPGDITMD